LDLDERFGGLAVWLFWGNVGRGRVAGLQEEPTDRQSPE